ncbi:hypothetical protein GPEL0_01r3992 [Geoanaerobacter pelophilus]|uniref:Uncharacterized protein n=1 Tax=Geoanaerobacter pelophilus TaxID=60036 RepID=A0ABQ0MLS4_9BACT|nr:hypothetical protein GPEL0_01r3992 [Geoanaerobacter pelophilus]
MQHLREKRPATLTRDDLKIEKLERVMMQPRWVYGKRQAKIMLFRAVSSGHNLSGIGPGDLFACKK